MISFVVSSFFAGVSGATMAMVLSIAQANNYKVAMTYEILLMVVLGGIGSISGSVIGSLLFVATTEWWLRGLWRTSPCSLAAWWLWTIWR